MIVIKNIKLKKKLKKRKKRKKLNKQAIKNLYKLLIISLFAFVYIYLFLNFSKIKLFKQTKEQLGEDLCNECLKLDDINLNPKCRECPTEILFKDIKFVSTSDTLNEIITHNRSISRFGDGEYLLISGKSIIFQRYNSTLGNKLKEVLYNDINNLLVGIYFPYKKEQLDLYYPNEVYFWKKWVSNSKFFLIKLLNKNKEYYAADITRFYFKYKDKSKVPQYIDKIRKIWDGKDIVFVEGDKTRLGYGNDFFNNSKSIKRIICPNFNAFNYYDKILNSVLKISKDKLILIALGPTATVLAYDLTKYGYQAIDIGHADIEYEYYLRKSTPQNKMKIRHKYGLGINKVQDVENITDKNYFSQIIDIISEK